MTSIFARNYNEKKLDRDYFLQTTKEGHPLQKQVPQTYQRYTGLGQESIDLDGSNRLVLETDLASGPLVIKAEDHYNLHGRVVHVLLTRTLQSPLTFDFGPDGLIHVPGSEATSTTLTLGSVGQTPTTFILDFYSLTDVMVTAEGSAIPGPPIRTPTVLNYVMALDEANVLDNELASTANITRRVQFDPDYVDSTNMTTVTYDETDKEFLISTSAFYVIMWDASYRGFLDRCLRNVITVQTGGGYRGRTWGVTSGGLVNQNISLCWAGFLNAGDVFYIESHYEPTIGPPNDGNYGLMNGVNTQNVTSRNFIKVIQL